MLGSVVALATAACVAGHADFLMVDASYRLNGDGVMYCSSSLGVGTKIMSFPVEASDAYSLVIEPAGDGVRVWFTGNQTGVEYIFEASAGAFEDGGCGGARSVLNGDVLALSPADAAAGATVAVSWANCDGAPPGECQVYHTSTDVKVLLA